MELEPGLRLGRYLLQEPLGKGAQGMVFHARQLNAVDGKPCVLKVAKKAALDEDERALFLEEARRAIRLGAHPNIVQVLDADEFEGVPFFVMEYSDGTDLETILRYHRDKGEALSWDAVYTILKHMADALHYAHFKRKIRGRSVGVIHRDIKPANTLVTFDGYAKLLDFGISVFRDDEHTKDHIRGTPQYMSPEHVYSTICPEMDVYSLGVVAWEMVQGKVFREGYTADRHYRAICHDVAPPVTNHQAPPALVELIATCLAEDKADRPTAAEFAKWLETCEGYRFSTESVGVMVGKVMGRDPRSRETEWNLKIPAEIVGRPLSGLSTTKEPKPRPTDASSPSAPTEPPKLPGAASEDGETVAWLRPKSKPDALPGSPVEPEAPVDVLQPRVWKKRLLAVEPAPDVSPTQQLGRDWVGRADGQATEVLPAPPQLPARATAPKRREREPQAGFGAAPGQLARSTTEQAIPRPMPVEARPTQLDLPAPVEVAPANNPLKWGLFFATGLLAAFGLATLVAFFLGAW